MTLFVALTHASWIATLRAAQELVMSDTPIRRDSPKLDGVVAAHERRTRLIAQLHEQAVAAAKDLSAQHKGIRTDAKDARRQRAEAWLFSAGAFLLALGCIAAVGCILAICL